MIKFNSKDKEQKNNLTHEEVILLRQTKKKIKKKYWKSRGLFVSLSLIALFVSAATVILNLFSIRFNEIPELTMDFFVAIAILSVLMTFLISLQSFFNIQARKNTLSDNIAKNQEILNQIKSGKEISQDDINEILNTIN
ncbi:hypothetical protein [Mycoplasmopsis glycophila]|uniref:DUF4231 domain-containing protein n=1 Tax=Mycoplasmopsis glycophila TaxID=171285 RepID=A0A449AV42_9BACT|nr:hypothetical protein [Mycoplasmopsis glycophila]VEU70394.1 Uncharacterised protein [Mycoplasmopsis glycophila]